MVSLVNWRRSQDRIDEVIVPESALAEGESLSYLKRTVDHALRTGMYLPEELPREAVIAVTLGHYLAGAYHDGHHLWVGNAGWCVETRSAIREGLKILEQHEAGRIFADLEAFAVLEPERFESEDWKYFKELDDRFGPVHEAADAAFAAWIRSRPWIRTMPKEEYYRTSAWETPNHRLREERLEARKGVSRRMMLDLVARMRSRREKGWRRWLWSLVAKWREWRAED